MGRRKSKTSSSGGVRVYSGNKWVGHNGGATTGGTTQAPRLEYADDNPGRMPVQNSQSQRAAARRYGRALSGRSGRASTRLSDVGTRSYVSAVLGSTL